MDFPARPAAPAGRYSSIERAFGLDNYSVYKSADLLVVLKSEEAVRRQFLLAVVAWRQVNSRAECPGKRLRGTIPAIQADIENSAVSVHKLDTSADKPPIADMGSYRLPHNERKHPVKIKWRKMKTLCKRLETHRLIQMIVDIFKRFFYALKTTHGPSSNSFVCSGYKGIIANH